MSNQPESLIIQPYDLPSCFSIPTWYICFTLSLNQYYSNRARRWPHSLHLCCTISLHQLGNDTCCFTLFGETKCSCLAARFSAKESRERIWVGLLGSVALFFRWKPLWSATYLIYSRHQKQETNTNSGRYSFYYVSGRTFRRCLLLPASLSSFLYCILCAGCLRVCISETFFGLGR